MQFQKIYTFEFLITLSHYGIGHFNSKDSRPPIPIAMLSINQMKVVA